MEILCTPWRFSYVTGQEKEDGCVFCNRLECDDREQFVLYRGRFWYIILNRFPYNNGHLLLVLNRHEQSLTVCTVAELHEMGVLLQVMEKALQEAYHPDGINSGYNGGECAGAGIPEHLHLHTLPRWAGDTNFMSTINATRVMPQALDQTYGLLAPIVQRLAAEVA